MDVIPTCTITVNIYLLVNIASYAYPRWEFDRYGGDGLLYAPLHVRTAVPSQGVIDGLMQLIILMGWGAAAATCRVHGRFQGYCTH